MITHALMSTDAEPPLNFFDFEIEVHCRQYSDSNIVSYKVVGDFGWIVSISYQNIEVS